MKKVFFSAIAMIAMLATPEAASAARVTSTSTEAEVQTQEADQLQAQGTVIIIHKDGSVVIITDKPVVVIPN